MMNCPSCGYPLEGNERYCGMCGTPVDHITKSMNNTSSTIHNAPSATGNVSPISPISPSPSKTAPLSPLHPTQKTGVRQMPLDSAQAVAPDQERTRGKLQRTRDRWIAGVIGGVANYIGINANLLRVIYIIVTYLLLIGGQGSLVALLVALYVVGIVLMPEEPIDWQRL